MTIARGFVLTLLLALSAQANAAETKSIDLRQHIHGRTTCAVVREVVAMIGAAETERMAREAGASEARIASAKRCLKP